MRRRPPFALVLVVLVAALAGAIALESSGGGHSVVPVPSGHAARACVTTHAEATAIAKRQLRAPVAVTVPVAATARTGRVAVTLSEKLVERALVTRTLHVRRAAVASDRACARGASEEAARSAALTRAYARALAEARVRANAAAAEALARFAAQQQPALVASAERQAEAHAQSAAIAARAALARRALARAQAGHR